MSRLSIPILALSVLVSFQAFGQQDAANSQDHPLLSRFEGSWINRYSQKQFEAFAYPTSTEMVDYDKLKDSKTVEGELTFIEYEAPEGVTATQVFRTYQTKLEKGGFKVLFSCRKGECGDMPMHFVRKYVEGSSSQIGNTMVGGKGAYLVASGTKEGEPYIVSLVVGDDSRNNSARYAINVVKVEELDTDKVDVASVSESLEKDGRFAFYDIQFDLNSATLQSGSAEALQVIASYLAAHPKTEVLIVGHTDNTGDFDHNIDLSKRRAEAVIKALVDDYSVNASQLYPVGVGMASPVASNADEGGRALNRRVELVLK